MARKQPMIMRGYNEDGTPMYAPVRVASEEQVRRIEEEIAKREQADRN